MPWRAVSVVCVVALVVAGLAGLAVLRPHRALMAGSLSWVLKEKIRAGYCNPGNSTSIVQRLGQSGINTLIVTYPYFDDEDPSTIVRLEDTAALYRAEGLHLLISVGFFAKSEAERHGYRHAVKKDGEEKVAPCPLDEKYWRDVLLKELVSVANASKTYPIDGVLIDTEMSVSPSATFYSPALCFCDDCFQRYARTTRKGGGVSSEAITRARRYEWLESRGYLEEYYGFLESKIEDLAHEVEREVHAVNPDLLLGFLLYFDTWFYRGLARGLGNPSMPVIVLDESTYMGGYTYLVDDMVEYFEENRLDVLYLPGLWLLHHGPANISAQMFHMAANTSGYWIFPLRSIWAEPQELTGDSAIAGPQAEYWDALGTANSELDKYLQSEGVYQTELTPPRPKASPYEFEVLEDRSAVVIHNTGSGLLAGHSFVDRHNVRVAINGKLVAKIGVIEPMGSSDPIPFEKKSSNTTSIYGEMGLTQIAVTDSSGRVYDLLGETDPQVFR